MALNLNEAERQLTTIARNLKKAQANVDACINIVGPDCCHNCGEALGEYRCQGIDGHDWCTICYGQVASNAQEAADARRAREQDSALDSNPNERAEQMP